MMCIYIYIHIYIYICICSISHNHIKEVFRTVVSLHVHLHGEYAEMPRILAEK